MVYQNAPRAPPGKTRITVRGDREGHGHKRLHPSELDLTERRRKDPAPKGEITLLYHPTLLPRSIGQRKGGNHAQPSLRHQAVRHGTPRDQDPSPEPPHY